MKQEYNHKPRQKTAAVFVFPSIISFLFLILYIYFQMSGLYGGDAGDFVTTSFLWGIPHPPGYPLYTFLSGLVMRIVPFGSVAWRACFLSSIPSALALFFLWRMCYRLSKSTCASTLVVFLYGLIGPVFVNAVTQEVFGLFSFLSIVFLERYTAWFLEGKMREVLFLSFWAGLSLTHHTLILLYVAPAVFYGFFLFPDRRKMILRQWWLMLLLFFLGFLPYVYAPIVSHFGTIFDHEHASTLSGFFRLVTRATYGSFRAVANRTPSLLDRLLNVYTFFQFTLKGFTFFGVFFIGVGLYSFRKSIRYVYDFLTIVLFCWIFYFFYAGFPLLINYQVGTLERFFIVPFQILVVFYACGIQVVLEKLQSIKKKNTVYFFYAGVGVLVGICILFNIPQWKKNFQAYQFLKTDQSMEHLGENMAKSVPENSILFVFEDTSAFSMYYYYFVLQKRQDIHFVFVRWLGFPRYRELIAKRYPDLVIPSHDEDIDYGIAVAQFLNDNLEKFPIVSDTDTDLFEGIWVPHGLVFIYFPKSDDSIPPDATTTQNLNLWEQFRLPNELIRYQKELVMLSDVTRVYGQHLAIVVRELAKNDAPLEQMRETMEKSLSLEINVVPEAYLYPIVLLYEKERCSEAKELLSMIYQKWGDEKPILKQYYLMKQKCQGDADIDKKAEKYSTLYPEPVDFFSKEEKNTY